MRSIRLARVAARAEFLLLQRLAVVAARRAAFGLVASVFAIAALALLHVIGVLALEQYAHLAPIVALAIVLGIDLAFAALCGALASGRIPDPVADEARRVRDLSLEQARQSLTVASLLASGTRAMAETGLLRLGVRMVRSGLRRSRA
jgi:hypothetical protein